MPIYGRNDIVIIMQNVSSVGVSSTPTLMVYISTRPCKKVPKKAKKIMQTPSSRLAPTPSLGMRTIRDGQPALEIPIAIEQTPIRLHSAVLRFPRLVESLDYKVTQSVSNPATDKHVEYGRRRSGRSGKREIYVQKK
jgi:hypothetical protein